MAAAFTQKDPLLRSQGLVTMYYWMVRECPQSRLPQLRQFLVEFDTARKANKRASKGNIEAGDSELLNYDLLDRSTNDQGSLEGRFEILRRRFESWQPT